MLTIDQFVDL